VGRNSEAHCADDPSTRSLPRAFRLRAANYATLIYRKNRKNRKNIGIRVARPTLVSHVSRARARHEVLRCRPGTVTICARAPPPAGRRRKQATAARLALLGTRPTARTTASAHPPARRACPAFAQAPAFPRAPPSTP